MRLIGNPLQAISLFLAAVLLGASFQDGLWPLTYVGLAIAAVLVEQRYAKLLPAIVAGYTFQLMGVQWTVETYGTLQNTEQRTLNWLLIGVLFFAFMPIMLMAGRRLRNRGWPLWLAFPIAWTVGDYARYEIGRLINSGPYPWLTLGLSQTDLLFLCQVADLAGVWGVGFIVAMFVAAIVQTALSGRVPVAPTLIVAAALVYGQWRMASTFEQGPTIALMPGYSQDVPSADFALWSESVFAYPQPIESRATLLQGCIRQEGDKTFNSLAILQGGQVVGMYDKCNLVPWSEFQPWKGRSRLTAGDKLRVFDRFGVAICYDVCFSNYMRRLAGEGPEFIAISANESIDPTMMLAYQLLAHSRLRAIEARRTIVRNANGGYSGVIDGNGRLQPILDFREPVVLDIPIDDRVSPYVWLGYWLPIGCLLVTVAGRPRLKAMPNERVDLVDNEMHRPIAH
jgi:apolipoprotein N-acyltransferase